MRVTNKMLCDNFLNDMRGNLGNLKTLQSQLTSGKEIRKPSDNPFKVARSLQLRSDIGANKQYNENISDTLNWLDATDTALDEATNSMQRIRELMIASGNAAYGSDELNAINDEMNQKIEELSQILNSNFDGKYIFGGSKGSSKPIGVRESYINGNRELYYSGKLGEELGKSNPQVNMIGAKLNVEISQGVTMEYNVTASELLHFTNNKGRQINVADLLNDITNNLSSKDPGDRDKVVGENLQDLSDAMGNLLKIRAEVGAKQNRMESAKNKNDDENFNMTELLSNTEDINFTEKMMDYSTAQTVYMASLQTSARIIQPSLMDFLK